MKKLLSILLSAGILIGSVVVGGHLLVARATGVNSYEPLVVFEDASTPHWTGTGMSVTYEDDLMKVTTSAAWADMGTGNGFIRNLTSDGALWNPAANKQADILRVYVKNPGAATDLYLQFVNADGEIWHQAQSVFTGTEIIAADYPLDQFTYRYGGTGPSGGAGTAWGDCKEEAGRQDSKFLQTFSMQMVIGASGTTLEFSKIAAITKAKGTSKFLYDFRNAASWGGTAGRSIEDGSLKLVNNGAYQHVQSPNGFTRNLIVDGTLTDDDVVRVYIKNPGAAVDFQLQYADGYAIVRNQTKTIAGGSSRYVAYDFPLGTFATPYEQTGDVGADKGNVHTANTWLADDPYADANSYSTWNFSMVFVTTAASTLYLSDLSAVRLAAETEPPLETRAGEPEHTPDYDLFEDFEYSTGADFRKAWKNDGSSAGTSLVQVETENGKAAMFDMSAAGSAVYLHSFAADAEREKYDRIRVWAKGSGRLFMQMNMPVPAQTDGSTNVSFIKEVSVSAAGGVIEVPIGSFMLPEWWAGQGNDTSITPDLAKINGMYLVCIATGASEIVLDNIGFREPDPPEVLPVRAGEPAHTKNYDVIDDFSTYASSIALQTAWKDLGSSPGASLRLADTPESGQAAMITMPGAGDATYLYSFAPDAGRAKYDRVRLWAKGKGRLFVQLNMPVPRQPNGSSSVSFIKELTVTEAGGKFEFRVEGLSLPSWWGDAGNDTSIKPDITKIDGMYLVCIAAEAGEIVVDNLGWMEPEPGGTITRNGEPEHEVNYEVIEDFGGYASNGALWDKWKDMNSSAGAEMHMINTLPSGRAARFVADAVGKTATYFYKFDESDDRAELDMVRIWAAGSGARLYMQLNMDCEEQPNGAKTVSFLRALQVIPVGEVLEMRTSSFALPDWWGTAGNDTGIKLDMAKVNGIYLVIIADGETDIVVDNIGFYKLAAGEDPNTNPVPQGNAYVFENFDGYKSDAALRAAWLTGVNTPNLLSLVPGSPSGSRMKVAADDVTVQVRSAKISETNLADWRSIAGIKLWTKGAGETVTLKLSCFVEPQEDGTDRLELSYSFPASETGAETVIPISAFRLPLWWTEENGYDSSVSFQFDEIIGFSAEIVGGPGSAVEFDDIVLIGSSPAKYTKLDTGAGGDSKTGDAGVLVPVLCVLLSAGALILVVKRRKART